MSLGDIYYKGVLSTPHIATGTITITTPGTDPNIIVTSDSLNELLNRINTLEQYIKILQQTYEIKNPVTQQIITLESLRLSNS